MTAQAVLAIRPRAAVAAGERSLYAPPLAATIAIAIAIATAAAAEAQLARGSRHRARVLAVGHDRR